MMKNLAIIPSFALCWFVAGPVGSAFGAEQAGVSAAVRGSVELTRASDPARGVGSGEKIFLDDGLRSGRHSGMQVLLLDETVFTLGENSEIVIDEFVYDPGTGRGRLDAEIVEGVFRFVSGQIAKERPEDVRLRLPSGTIGIRGTIVAGEVHPDGSALVVLLGPGRNSNTQDRPGAVRVEAAGRHVDLVRANWATRIPGPGQAPTQPFPMALPNLDALTGALAGPGPAPIQKEERPVPTEPVATAQAQPSATKMSGQATAMGATLGERMLADVRRTNTVAQMDAVAAQAPIGSRKLATVQELAGIGSGAAVYNRPGLSFAAGGSLDFGFVVDFGKEEASFGIQNIVSPLLAMPPGNGIALNAVATEFAQGSNGKALFDIPANFVFGPICTPCDVLVEAGVFNVDGQVAREAQAKISVRAGPLEAKADTGPIPGFYVP